MTTRLDRLAGKAGGTESSLSHETCRGKPVGYFN